MKGTTVWVTLALLFGQAPTASAEGRVQSGQRVLEVYKVSAHVALNEDGAVRERVAAGLMLGSYRIDAYVLVVRLDPGERFVEARLRVRDGFVCRERRGAAWTAGRVLGQVGYRIALAEVPTELHAGLNVLGGLIAPPEPAPRRPQLKRKIALGAHRVDHGQGYVTAFLPLATSALTRVELTRIVTERPGQRDGTIRLRGWAHPVLVPGPEASGITRAELLHLLESHDPSAAASRDERD